MYADAKYTVRVPFVYTPFGAIVLYKTGQYEASASLPQELQLSKRTFNLLAQGKLNVCSWLDWNPRLLAMSDWQNDSANPLAI